LLKDCGFHAVMPIPCRIEAAMDFFNGRTVRAHDTSSESRQAAWLRFGRN
jgi:hypothetical protein